MRTPEYDIAGAVCTPVSRVGEERHNEVRDVPGGTRIWGSPLFAARARTSVNELAGPAMSIRITGAAQLDAHGVEHPFVALTGWKFHRLDRSCADWRAYLLPDVRRGMGDSGMTLYANAEVEALVRAGENTFCRVCCQVPSEGLHGGTGVSP